MVKGPGKKLITIPAVYKTVTEKVLISPEHTEWKKGTPDINKRPTIFLIQG